MFKMSKINNNIMYICEGIILLLIMYNIYSYMYSLNTKINTLNNKLNIIETFLHESNITTPLVNKVPIPSQESKSPSQESKSPSQESKSPSQESKSPSQESKKINKHVKFNSKLNQTQELEKHIDNIDILRQQVIMNFQQPNTPNHNLFKQPNKIVEIDEPSPNKKRKLEEEEEIITEVDIEDEKIEEVDIEDEKIEEVDIEDEKIEEVDIEDEKVEKVEDEDEQDEVDTSKIVEIDEEPEDVD